MTNHAVLRYQERVARVSMEQAREDMQSRAVETAVRFGARYVKLSTGQILAIRDGVIITVLPKGFKLPRFNPYRERVR